jgi:anti-sigma B factor antagonist
MSLTVSIDNSTPARITVAVTGKLDAMTYIDFDRQLDPVLAQIPHGGTLVVNLAGLEYVSSAGLRSLFRARKAMRASGGHSLLLNAQPQVRRVFEIVKAVPVNEIFANVAELDAYLDAMQKKVIEDNADE